MASLELLVLVQFSTQRFCKPLLLEKLTRTFEEGFFFSVFPDKESCGCCLVFSGKRKDFFLSFASANKAPSLLGRFGNAVAVQSCFFFLSFLFFLSFIVTNKSVLGANVCVLAAVTEITCDRAQSTCSGEPGWLSAVRQFPGEFID